MNVQSAIQIWNVAACDSLLGGFALSHDCDAYIDPDPHVKFTTESNDELSKRKAQHYHQRRLAAKVLRELAHDLEGNKNWWPHE